MALQSVKFTLNGQTYDLTLDGATGQYKATITAPAESSWGAAEDHKYHGTVEAKDLAGNTAQATVTQFPGLGLRVLEKTKPTISVTYPTNGAYIPSSQPTITWTVLDDGSGIDPDTIQISVDSGAATADGIQTEATEGAIPVPTPLPRRWETGPTPSASLSRTTTATRRTQPRWL